MTDKHDHPPGDASAATPHSPDSATAGHSHLAHWPPPQRGHEIKHAPVKHLPGEQPHQEKKPHGWGLTRSVFKDDDD